MGGLSVPPDALPGVVRALAARAGLAVVPAAQPAANSSETPNGSDLTDAERAELLSMVRHHLAALCAAGREATSPATVARYEAIARKLQVPRGRATDGGGTAGGGGVGAE